MSLPVWISSPHPWGAGKAVWLSPPFSCSDSRQLKLRYEETVYGLGSPVLSTLWRRGCGVWVLEEMWLAWVPYRDTQSPAGPRTCLHQPGRRSCHTGCHSVGDVSFAVSQTSLHGPAWPWALCSASLCPYFPQVENENASTYLIRFGEH